MNSGLIEFGKQPCPFRSFQLLYMCPNIGFAPKCISEGQTVSLVDLAFTLNQPVPALWHGGSDLLCLTTTTTPGQAWVTRFRVYLALPSCLASIQNSVSLQPLPPTSPLSITPLGIILRALSSSLSSSDQQHTV